MKDKIVLITGSTDGIGKQTAIELAQKGATVLIHGRSLKRGKAVIEEIIRQTNNSKIDLFISDFSSLKQVKELAEEIKAKHSGSFRTPSTPTIAFKPISRATSGSASGSTPTVNSKRLSGLRE